MDRESIVRESNEYSKSGSDSKAATEQEAAFEPNRNDPQAEKEKAGEGVSDLYHCLVFPLILRKRTLSSGRIATKRERRKVAELVG